MIQMIFNCSVNKLIEILEGPLIIEVRSFVPPLPPSNRLLHYMNIVFYKVGNILNIKATLPAYCKNCCGHPHAFPLENNRLRTSVLSLSYPSIIVLQNMHENFVSYEYNTLEEERKSKISVLVTP